MAWTLPNTITLTRLAVAAVLFVMLAFAPTSFDELGDPGRWLYLLAMVVFLIAASSDFLDGWLARKYGLVSAFGRVADPFVDKVLICGSLIFLCANPITSAHVPAWVVVVLVSREFLVTTLRGYMESIGRQFPADRLGKLKMVAQCAAVSFALGHVAFTATGPAPDGSWTSVGTVVLVWVTLLLTVISGTSYVFKARRDLFA